MASPGAGSPESDRHDVVEHPLDDVGHPIDEIAAFDEHRRVALVHDSEVGQALPLDVRPGADRLGPLGPGEVADPVDGLLRGEEQGPDPEAGEADDDHADDDAPARDAPAHRVAGGR